MSPHFENLPFQEIAADRHHGSTELARRCLEILGDCLRQSAARTPVELVREAQILADTMRNARPSMAPIRNLLTQWIDELARLPLETLDETRTLAIECAMQLRDRAAHAGEAIARHAAQALAGHRVIFTHSVSSVILSVFQELRSCPINAIVTESRPMHEGRRMAARFSEWGIATTFITDAQMGIFISSADCVLVGADAVLSDRSIINKAGTYLLALAAADRGIPFYVGCESFKGVDSAESAKFMEELSPGELEAPELPNITPRNIYFDCTPARLVSGWITEQGVALNESRQSRQHFYAH